MHDGVVAVFSATLVVIFISEKPPRPRKVQPLHPSSENVAALSQSASRGGGRSLHSRFWLRSANRGGTTSNLSVSMTGLLAFLQGESTMRRVDFARREYRRKRVAQQSIGGGLARVHALFGNDSRVKSVVSMTIVFLVGHCELSRRYGEPRRPATRGEDILKLFFISQV